MGVKRAKMFKSYVRPLKCLDRNILYTKQYCYLVNKLQHQENELERSFCTLFEVSDKQNWFGEEEAC